MRYLLKRLGFYLLAAFAAVTMNFFLPRLMPGDPPPPVRALQGQAVPRIDRRIARRVRAHAGAAVEAVPHLSVARAARRVRDLDRLLSIAGIARDRHRAGVVACSWQEPR
jgi:hypothetical protein